jgi:hypothetical protein
LLQQKLQSAKYSAKNNAKNNTKKASELRETKKAENDTLVAQGISIDAALRPDVVKTIALKVVKKSRPLWTRTARYMYSLLLSAELIWSLLRA